MKKTAPRPKPAAVSPLTGTLARYVAATPRRRLPPAVIEKTKHHLLDTIAAMVSGTKLVPGGRAIACARAFGGPPEASIPGTGLVVHAMTAALAGGMLAHADETDDSHAPSLSHPGCGVVPAALAVAERGRAGGAALLRAVALGYDVCARMGYALDAYRFRDAGHSSHSFGPLFGAAAAAAALSGFDERRVRHVLSYAAQQASGVSCWMRDEEHVEKAFDFGGMPARNAVAAATMVAAGSTGVEDVFSGERNFFVAFGLPTARPGKLVQGLGSTYEILATNIKRWSVGSPIQAALDSLDALIRAHRLRADDVAHVRVEVSRTGANTTDDRPMPDICMQHLCAVMLIDRTVTFESSHDEARMRDPRVLALRRRIEAVGSDALQKRLPSRQAIVDVWTTDGRHLRHHTRAVRGTAENPMTRDEVDGKCVALLAPVLGARRARRLADAVWGIDRLDDVRALRRLWSA